jgi:hypothetical protein
MAVKSKEEAIAPEAFAVRVEFYGSDGKFGYRRCAIDGSVTSEVAATFVEVADAVEAAIADDANAGLKIQDPSFTHRPFAGW